MPVHSLRLASALVAGLLTFTSGLSAQVSPIPNTGCADGVTDGNEVFPIDGQSPVLGNLTFALEHVCASDSNAVFVLFGLCEAPLVDWNLSNSCFGSWLAPPSTCGKAVADLSMGIDGGFTRQNGKFTFAFPIPNLPALQTITQTSPICMQWICVDLTDASPCRSVSEGISLTIQ